MELEFAAHHEGGHAIAFHVLGLGVASVSIKADPISRRAGHTVPVTDLAAEPAIGILHATAALAGALAVKRWRPDRLDWEAGAAGDIERAHVLVRAAAGESVLRRAAVYLDVRTRAEQLVAEHWRAVELIAKELMMRGTLDGTAVARLCAGVR